MIEVIEINKKKNDNNMDEKQIPQVRVGIMNEPDIEFVLNGEYRVNGAACSGDQGARCVDGQVEWNGNRYGELLFEVK